MKNKVIRYSALVLIVFVMCMIFYFSAQPADLSDETSGGVIEQLLTVFYPRYNNLDEFAQQDIVITLVLPIRILAHFFEFFLLGVFSFVFLSTFSGTLKNHRLVFTFLFGLLYSVSDELHQLFVPGRACQFSDVCVDAFGVFIAIMICAMLSRVWRRKHREQ